MIPRDHSMQKTARYTGDLGIRIAIGPFSTRARRRAEWRVNGRVFQQRNVFISENETIETFGRPNDSISLTTRAHLHVGTCRAIASGVLHRLGRVETRL